MIDDALGDEVRVTVIAAGFDGGTPSYRPSEPARVAPPAAPADGGSAAASRTEPAAGATGPAPSRRVLFDDVDVPDFLKNGS